MILRMIYSYSMKKYVLTNRLPFLTLFIITFIIIGFRLKLCQYRKLCVLYYKKLYIPYKSVCLVLL